MKTNTRDGINRNTTCKVHQATFLALLSLLRLSPAVPCPVPVSALQGMLTDLRKSRGHYLRFRKCIMERLNILGIFKEGTNMITALVCRRKLQREKSASRVHDR